MMRAVKIVSVMLALILAAGLVFALIKNHNRESELTERAEQLENVLRPLYSKLSDLENEKAALKSEIQKQINGTATVSLLYTEAVPEIYEIFYPEMKRYDYCAVVALSDDTFPGTEGYMSVERFSEILGAGWKWSVTFPAESETPMEDVERLLERAQAAGFGRTSLMYFPEGSYSKRHDAWLAASGFTSVMHHAEEEMPVIAEHGVSDGIFYQCAVNWRLTTRRNYLSSAISKFGSMAFEMNIRTDSLSSDVSYHTSMLEVLEEYRSGGSLSVMNPDEANRYHLSVKAGGDGYSDAWESSEAEINSQITALWDEIERVRRQYAESFTD